MSEIPDPLGPEEFIELYINFNKKLAEAEERLPRKYWLYNSEARLDLFRFWFADHRDQQLFALNTDEDDNDDNERFWES